MNRHIKHLLGMAMVFQAMENDLNGKRSYSGPDPKYCDLPECKKPYQHRGRYCSKDCKLKHDEQLKAK